MQPWYIIVIIIIIIITLLPWYYKVTRKSLEERNAPKKPIVYKRQNL